MAIPHVAANSRFYAKAEWLQAVLLFVAYVSSYVASAMLFPAVEINPAYAIAFASVFFGGYRLLPIVYVSALVACIVAMDSAIFLFVVPVAAVAQSAVGGFLARYWEVDPIFRRDQDVFALLGILAIVSLIFPTLHNIVHMSMSLPHSGTIWLHEYVATLFAYMILAPFILRWVAKPSFRRTSKEAIEEIAVFSILIMVNTILFIQGVPSVYGVSLVYLLLIPLFIIALRHRPRFVTLSLVITSAFALTSAYAVGGVAIEERVFQTELFLIVIGVIFLIIAALEEHRRLSTTSLFTQVATLQNVVAKLSSESRAKNDFIAILAHELRNPLSPVVSGIDLLRLKGPRDDDEAKTLDFMQSSMQTVRSLLDDMLDVSRISEGKIHLDKKLVGIHTVLTNAVRSTEHHRKERHQELEFKIKGKNILVMGDPVRLEQVFSNLLTNASKYSEAGDVITLIARQQENAVEIEVIDEGVGIDAHMLRSIFLPFHQVDEGRRTKEGLGIGLALVKSFVEMHDGTVTAHSEGSGSGSTFVVRLPLAPKIAK